MNRIQRYFNALADRIAADAEIAGSSAHRPDIGSNRELIVQRFLSKHLPKRLTSALGGQVIGLSGTESAQIDVLVSNDVAVRFEQNEKSFVVAEGVAAAISVKSFLDKTAIEDSLANPASIPQFDRTALDFKLLANDPFSAFIDKHPTLCVFAYDGVHVDTCLRHITNFYHSHSEIPNNRYALYIVVNGKYMIWYCRTEVRTTTGYVVEPGEFFPIRLEDEMKGYPFIAMLNAISSYTDWLPFMHVHIHRYFNVGYSLPNATPTRFP